MGILAAILYYLKVPHPSLDGAEFDRNRFFFMSFLNKIFNCDDPVKFWVGEIPTISVYKAMSKRPSKQHIFYLVFYL